MDNLSQTDVILSKYRFIPHNFRRDARWNFWSSGSYGSLDSQNKTAEIVSYSYFYWKKYDCNWVTKLRSRYYCNMSCIRPRLIRCHWSFDPRWVKISGHSEQLGPCGSTSHFVNNRHSKVKTRGASCIGGFGQTDGRRKFELGIPQSRGALILEVHLILETRRYSHFTSWVIGPWGYLTSLKSINFKLISTINIWSIFCEIAIRWMPQYITDH